MFLATLVIFLAGIAAFSIRLGPRIAARVQHRRDDQKMARHIRAVVQRQNLRQAVATLRDKPRDAGKPLERPAPAELLGRMTDVKLRIDRCTPPRRETRRRPVPQTSGAGCEAVIAPVRRYA